MSFEDDTKVSIIIPCYNPPRETFENTILSLKKIDPKIFHLILIDDGSKEKDYISLALKYFPNLQLIQSEINNGPSAARNSGVKNCKTKYYIQLDADDQISEEFIRQGITLLDKKPEWSFCNAWINVFGSREYQIAKGFEHGSNFLITNAFPPIALIRTDVDREIGGHDEKIRQGNEDWDYWLRMAAHGHWGLTIPEFLNSYCKHQIPTYWPNRDHPTQKARFRYKMWWRYKDLIINGFWHRIEERWKRMGYPLDELNDLKEHNRKHPEYPSKFQLSTRIIGWSFQAIGIHLKKNSKL